VDWPGNRLARGTDEYRWTGGYNPETGRRSGPLAQSRHEEREQEAQ